MVGRTGLALCLLGCLTGAAEEPPATDDVAFFEAKVRPILVERCYACHSASAENVRGGLLLDTREASLKGGDIGPAVVPGKPDESLLVTAVRWDDESLRMPPKGNLPAAEVALLEEWVKRGAPDPRVGAAPATAGAKPKQQIHLEEERQHWAYQPLARVSPPEGEVPPGWEQPIDRFLLVKQREKGLEPSRQADARVLVRRLYLDVTGLPPSPEEVAAFLAVGGDNAAYERLVDQLLASPHFGERWARHWLDLARFGESHGFEHDYDRPTAYHYRDFLIDAFNRDMPFDQFLTWQLAGDEVAPGDYRALQATGFLAAGVHSTQITASQAEKERYDELDDMVSTTGTAFLGLTLGCARCHDHKYDPIAVQDYYRLAATFTTTVRTEVDLDLDPEGGQRAREAFAAAHAPLVAAVEAFERDELPGRFERWEAARKQAAEAGTFPWLVLDLKDAKSSGGATLTPLGDGSLLASGTNPQHESYTFTARVDRVGLTAIRLEALADASLVKGGPGRASNGNFALTDFQVTAAPADHPEQASTVELSGARATFEQPGLPAAAAIDADGTSGWAVDPQFGRDHAAAFEAKSPFGYPGGTILTFRLSFTNNVNHAIGRVRLAVTGDGGRVPLDAGSIAQEVLQGLETPAEQRSPETRALLLNWYRTLDPEWQRLKEAERKHNEAAPRATTVKALISSEGLPAVRLHTQGPDFYEKTFLLRRGDPTQKVEEVSAGFLPVMMPTGADGMRWRVDQPEGSRTSYRRAALAAWMIDTEQGAGALVARVAVNRLWQHAFGRGLVATPSDFGMQGERPSHPELLEYLANRLVAEGWRLKPVLRELLLSAAYRQVSTIDGAKARLDVDNVLVWRQNRRRLEAEVIRDAMLSTAGELDETMLGPGTLDEGMKRRSIYFTVKRSQLIPMMSQFDAPDALVPIAVRSNTTVAPQALLLLNSPRVRAWAEALARRVEQQAASEMGDRIDRAYLLVLGRGPDDEERKAAGSFLIDQARSRGDEPGAEASALADFCQGASGVE